MAILVVVSWNGYTIATRPRETWKGCVGAEIVGMFLLSDKVRHLVLEPCKFHGLQWLDTEHNYVVFSGQTIYISMSLSV
jgi:hypothetical protein